ncbi:DUF2007 domain-containing protein [Thalassomonas viridans]|uniref:DUF2007 domain-containing protein n=2 Tax=Thalassomonas viridans TaxID=137584 RepID=A0AAF0CCB7_9GAMM|nr:DUF2007 domain-containing protein [Thalassomonas viridans]WDE08323.1 DUF2007 domain-containing protein [Thalassomonas viridans]
MKLVYTNENLFLVANVKNILEAQRIEVMLKNEFSLGAIGEISAFDAWPELWLVNESDYEKAMAVIEASSSHKGADEWICNHCCERNDASFEICWNCQSECG